MSAARGVRGIVASLFFVSVAATGVVAAAVPAGAGPKPEPNCKIPFTPTPREANAEVVPTEPTEKPAHCATLEVTKVVTGTPQASPPAGTEFTVHVSCAKTPDDEADAESFDGVDNLPPGQKPPFEKDLTFPSNGGTQSILVAAKRPSECTVSETPPAGCTLTSIDPEKTAIEEPVVYPVTVTNNCDPAPQPEVAAAGAATAVVTTPRFTG
jgi:Domain of unknown function (DUF5979)